MNRVSGRWQPGNCTGNRAVDAKKWAHPAPGFIQAHRVRSWGKKIDPKTAKMILDIEFSDGPKGDRFKMRPNWLKNVKFPSTSQIHCRDHTKLFNPFFLWGPGPGPFVGNQRMKTKPTPTPRAGAC